MVILYIMSAQSNASAKRRRAGNIGATSIFKSEDNNTSSQSVSSTPNNTSMENNQKKPMSLQQVITVFDQRLLHIEKIIIEQNQSNPVSIKNDTQQNNNTETINLEIIDEFRNQLNNSIIEFDHRYNILANEIVDLKKIILKLQSYTLDVNKFIIKEHMQIIKNTEPVQIELNDDLNLKHDLDIVKTDISTNTEDLDEGIKETVEEDLVEGIKETVEEDLNEGIKETVEEDLNEGIKETVEEDLDEEETVEQELLDNMIEHVTQEIVRDPYAKDSEPWDEDTTDNTTQILDNLNQQHLEIDISASSKENNQETPEKKKKGKKKEKKSMSVVIDG